MENDASMEIRKQRGFPQAARLRRISHRPDGGNASPSTCFQAAAIHLKIGNFLSEENGYTLKGCACTALSQQLK